MYYIMKWIISGYYVIRTWKWIRSVCYVVFRGNIVSWSFVPQTLCVVSVVLEPTTTIIMKTLQWWKYYLYNSSMPKNNNSPFYAETDSCYLMKFLGKSIFMNIYHIHVFESMNTKFHLQTFIKSLGWFNISRISTDQNSSHKRVKYFWVIKINDADVYDHCILRERMTYVNDNF